VHADELVRPVGDRGEARDGNGACVGGEIGVRGHDFADRAEDLFLDFTLLGRGLDHEVCLFERLDGGRRPDALETGLHSLVRDHVALDLAVHVAFDHGHAPGQGIVGNIGHDDIIPG